MLQPAHKLHSLLPRKHLEIRERKPRANGQNIYDFFCKTERFKHNTNGVFDIDKYNYKLN